MTVLEVAVYEKDAIAARLDNCRKVLGELLRRLHVDDRQHNALLPECLMKLAHAVGGLEVRPSVDELKLRRF